MNDSVSIRKAIVYFCDKLLDNHENEVIVKYWYYDKELNCGKDQVEKLQNLESIFGDEYKTLFQTIKMNNNLVGINTINFFE